MNRPRSGNQILWQGLILLMAINFFQAIYTELDPDEAYYWMYSKQLDWGYFDHPPMIALLVKLGASFLYDELGVRLGTVLLQPVTFYIVWLILGKPQDRQTVLGLLILFAAQPMLQIYGFVAVPDSPLLFFIALFYLAYQRFLKEDNGANTVFLGLMMAAMLYSKYHGVLIILLLLLSNLKLLQQPRAYLAVLVGVIAFIPHLYWQYANDFPSFRYHLISRSDPYRFEFTITYLVNQLIVFSPFLLPIFLWITWRNQSKGIFLRGMRFTIWGFLIFFFFMSFRGHVEPHWTVALSIPFVILTMEYLKENPTFSKRIQLWGGISFALLIVARIWIIAAPPPFMKQFAERPWLEALHQELGDQPVYFQNSYRIVSKYAFYSAVEAYTFSDYTSRKNQFDIWDWEQNFQNKKVAVVGQRDWECAPCKDVKVGPKQFKVQVLDSIQITQNLKISLLEVDEIRASGKSINLSLLIENPYAHAINLDQKNWEIELGMQLYQDGELEVTIPLNIKQQPRQIPDHSSIEIHAVIEPINGLDPGMYEAVFGLSTGDLRFSIHSTPYTYTQ